MTQGRRGDLPIRSYDLYILNVDVDCRKRVVGPPVSGTEEMNPRQVFGWSYRVRRFWRNRGAIILWIVVALVLGALIWSVLVTDSRG